MKNIEETVIYDFVTINVKYTQESTKILFVFLLILIEYEFLNIW